MPSKHQMKIYKIISGLYVDVLINGNTERPTIKRHQLKRIIQRTLHITGPHSINIWVDNLIGVTAISLNPTTSLSAKKRLFRPTNDTKYYINKVFCERLHQEHIELIKKQTHTHVAQPTYEQRTLEI